MNGEKMIAVAWTAYGPPEVVKLEEVNVPTLKNNEVLIQIYATTLHGGDTRIRECAVHCHGI